MDEDKTVSISTLQTARRGTRADVRSEDGPVRDEERGTRELPAERVPSGIDGIPSRPGRIGGRLRADRPPGRRAAGGTARNAAGRPGSLRPWGRSRGAGPAGTRRALGKGDGRDD
ncbi:hypothetical protein GCM10023238_20660 [Streptomyces heliomycini]